MPSKNRKNKANSDTASNGRKPGANGQDTTQAPPTPPAPPVPEVKPPAGNLDPFDPKQLRQVGIAIDVGKPSPSVRPRRPHKSWFIRVHPSPDYRFAMKIIELEDDTEKYWVHPDVLPHLEGDTTLVPRLLVLAVNAQGVFFIWPVPLPGEDGNIRGNVRSALEAVDKATAGWVRVQWNQGTKEYDSTPAKGNLPEPEWLDATFRDLLAIAFRRRLIDSLDHPVLRRLRGEAK
jgi:hypothetical protein